MTINEINQMPVTFSHGGGAVHESIYKSYHALQRVKDLLRKGTPPAVVLEFIDEMGYGERKVSP